MRIGNYIEVAQHDVAQERRRLREIIGKKRHYDLEEFDHDSKMMSVGFNQALDTVLEELTELRRRPSST